MPDIDICGNDAIDMPTPGAECDNCATKSDLAHYYTKDEADDIFQEELEAGDGITFTGNVISADLNPNNTYDANAVDGLLALKQDELVAGVNINITGNVISAVGSGMGLNYVEDRANQGVAMNDVNGNTVTGHYATAAGNQTTASGIYSFAEGYRTTASGQASHAEGYSTVASNIEAHAEGQGTEALGQMSHAEGINSEASGDYSHAEGGSTFATSHYTHAEGYQSTASGIYAHAEGKATIAAGNKSHAQNEETIANADAQTAMGRFNVEDNSNQYALIIGNGNADNDRANALTVDWGGNEKLAGKLTMGTGVTPTNAKDAVTKDYLDGSATALTVASGITASRGGCNVRKLGEIVLINGGIGNATSTVSTSTNLFSILPSDYRPSAARTIYGWVNDAEASFSVRADGYIRQTLSSNMNNCFFSGWYAL